VVVTRHLTGEPERLSLSLTDCDGKPNPSALDALSVLARSRHVGRPEQAALRAYQGLPIDKGPQGKRRHPGYVAPEIMRLHEGLLTRLQRVAELFPGRPIEIVSGHRPEARLTSRHHHGRALDFRLEGVTRERLRDALRGFEQTGVGYYPNSTFVHMDVRDDKGYWVDRSGPGEAADYGAWPPPAREVQTTQDRILRGALAELAQLGSQRGLPAAMADPRADRGREARGRLDAAGANALGRRSLESAHRLLAAAEGASRPHVETRAEPPSARTGDTPPPGPRGPIARDDSEPGDQLSPREIARIRREAVQALRDLR
jgi:hypothetical protein